MSVHIVRFTTEPENVSAVEEAIGDLFTAIDAVKPSGIDYTAIRVGDSEFLLILRLDDAEVNPLTAIPEAIALRTRIADWSGGPVPPVRSQVLGRYSR
ncbi:hypothetical protein FB566_0664 [Stackebrandtia endophytica]|uniref:Antibiotic biosynthesis monooxygenase n=1 Tax=Stackebrandtia endophytica TaxID=1496996 RepID=A0A543ARF3_9ACTN|nr:hypothetical protein [Stackebrandtia endophytica]TQL75168.1 hypothetical protein FB566_0664 [Stackebrandtia endophytica]